MSIYSLIRMSTDDLYRHKVVTILNDKKFLKNLFKPI